MANYPANIWLIDEDQFDKFTFTGGKVVYIAEEVDGRFATHPAIITAGALLPPIDAIQAELDGMHEEAEIMYMNYLQNPDSLPFISILVLAAIQQVPIGLMFGEDEMNMQFPKMFINILYRLYGLVIGIDGRLQPYIEEQYMPFDLAVLYNLNIINYEMFMTLHPLLPIHPSVVSKMAYEEKPPVKEKDIEHYAEYFNNVITMIRNNNGSFLIEPLVGD